MSEGNGPTDPALRAHLWDTESGHRLAPKRCSELMPTDADCDCGERQYQRRRAALAAEAAPPEHRPEWQDDAPTGWCECGQPNGHTVPNVDCTPSAAEAAPLDVERLKRAMSDHVESRADPDVHCCDFGCASDIAYLYAGDRELWRQ